MSGIERKIDNLGRIVIPISYRKALRLQNNDSVTVSLENGNIIISAKRRICAICGSALECIGNIRICQNCINAIKENENG